MQALSFLGPHGLRGAVRDRALVRLWRNAYAVPMWRAPALGSASAPRGSGVVTASRRLGLLDPTAVHRIAAPVWTRLAAAELTLPGPTIACLHTAAELYGFAIDADDVTHLIGERSTTLTGVTVHRTRNTSPLQAAGRFHAVDAAETAIRLAACAPHPARSLALLDASLRSGFVTPATLTEIAVRLHVDGVGAARGLVALADSRAESPAESWLRWLCHDAGLPSPEPQYRVRCAGSLSYRLDLAWPAASLGLEYDGVEFHTGAALTRDRARLNALTAAGWTILAVTAPMLTTGRRTLVTQISERLRTAGVLAR